MSEIVTIVQARLGSSRLPGKVLCPVLGKPILVWQMERVLRAKLSGKVVIATTDLPSDDAIAQLAREQGWHLFRGHPTDLLDRHLAAGKAFNAKYIVKIPSDCPLIDPAVIDAVIGEFLTQKNSYDYFSNLHPPTHPDGNDVEIMHLESLEIAWREATLDFAREHTTPYLWDNPRRFRIGNHRWPSGLDLSQSHRFVLDYPDDLDFISQVISELHPLQPHFGLDDILKLLEEKPWLMDINRKYCGVNWYRNHLDELRTIGKNDTRDPIEVK